jgi:heme iron utilization protein
MQPTDDFAPARVAKSLLRRRREGALATLMRDGGAPYCSLVNLASAPDGSPVLLISRLAVHTRNLLADPRVSLMLDERAAGDPLQGARIMLMGEAVAADPAELPTLRRRYLAAHPGAEAYIDFKDFSLFRIITSGAHLVAGFGRIVDLAASDYLTDLGGADDLLDAEASAVEHMNADHLIALNLYATRLLGRRGRLALHGPRSRRARSAGRCSGVATRFPATGHVGRAASRHAQTHGRHGARRAVT